MTIVAAVVDVAPVQIVKDRVNENHKTRTTTDY